jgi:hypothetical protein
MHTHIMYTCHVYDISVFSCGEWEGHWAEKLRHAAVVSMLVANSRNVHVPALKKTARNLWVHLYIHGIYFAGVIT